MEAPIQNDTPDGWQTYRIGDVTQRTKQRNPAIAPERRFTYIDVSAVSNTSFRITEPVELLGADAPSRARKIVHTGDVLFATVRPTLKRVALVPERLHDQIASTGYIILRADSAKLDSRYLYFRLLTDDFITRMRELERGASYPAVRDTDVLNENIPIPPLPEQRKIAEVLGVVQRGIEQQERLLQLTAELKKTLLHQLFTQGLRGEPQKQTEIGPVPESWEVAKIGDVAKLQSGGTPARDASEYWQGGTIPWVKTGEIDYCVIWGTGERITPAGMANSAAKLFPEGTLLMAMYGQGVTRGRVAILGIEAATNQACAAITPRDEARVSSRFLYYFLEYQYENLRKLGHGANQRNMNAALIRGFPVSFPTPVDQNKIISALSALDVKSAIHQRKHSAFSDLFRTLLHQLMTAQIRVHDLDLSVLGTIGLGGENSDWKRYEP